MSWFDFLPDISLPEHVDIDIINIGDDVDGDLVQGDVVEGDQVDANYAIESQGDIIPISEINRIVVGELPGDVPVELRDNNEELVLDAETVEKQREWEEVSKPGLKAGWEEEGAVSTESAYPILLQAERNITDEKITEIKSFFEGKIFTSDYLLLQSSLTIDQVMNAGDEPGWSDEELKSRKRQLADKYHDAAFTLPSLCTSGYFDADGLFREVYETMAENEEYDVSNYDSVFRTMISKRPFVAYARESLSEIELTDIIRGKINRLPSYDIPLPYIDVRGIGRSNHQKIRTAMETIEAESGGIEYDERVGNEELVVRIDADSIRQND